MANTKYASLAYIRKIKRPNCSDPQQHSNRKLKMVGTRNTTAILSTNPYQKGTAITSFDGNI
jgi:hypothetical protein